MQLWGAARLLAGIPHDRPMTYAEHLAAGGRRIHRSQEWLCDAARQVGLLGRGGAAFPVAVKLGATPPGRSTEILVNGSESDPSSSKDRVLMRHAPHRVLDGVLAVADALGTTRVTIAVHDAPAGAALDAACRERPDAGAIRVGLVPGGFVAGEVRALIHGAQGEPAVPDGRRVLPHLRGLHGRPTYASNVETFAQLGQLAALGVADYAALGMGEEPGTSLVTMHGHVLRPGVAEVPHGVPLDLLTGPREGRPMLVGGYHGAWTSEAGLVLDRRGLSDRGAPWGAGVIAVLPDTTCALGEVTRVAHWLAGQSAGQCGPCLFGLHGLARDLAAVYAGSRIDLDGLRRRAGLAVGRGACAHPDGAVRFVGTALDAFAEEVEVHRSRGGCGRPILEVLPLPEVES
jgi:NADH:ubiquinone oxidoreductase subunit F (NADH-binding)